MERVKYIYVKDGKGVIVKYNGRSKMWHAELHTDKKMQLYQYETLEEIRSVMKDKGYELISMSFKAPDYTAINSKKWRK
jgi:hypothetical protein